MAEGGGFFAGIGDLIDKIKSPPDLILILGIGMFGWGVVKEPFSMTNTLISWGLICMTCGMGLRLCAEPFWEFSTTTEDYRYIRWKNVIGGAMLLIACAELVFHQFAGRWLPWRH